MNIVTESKKREITNSIDDCLKPDGITNNLWIWAERLERFGKILFWFIIIFGFIVAIPTSTVVEETVNVFDRVVSETKFSVVLFLTNLGQTALYAFIEYCAYHMLALLISALANITQNTKTTAKLTEYMARKTTKVEAEEDNADNTSPDNASQAPAPIENKAAKCPATAEIRNGEKICPVCGMNQKIERKVCWSCGQEFDN